MVLKKDRKSSHKLLHSEKGDKRKHSVFNCWESLCWERPWLWAGFVCSNLWVRYDSVLWLFAQCLLYAGSVFGISIYINSRFNNLIEQLKEKEGKK